MCKHTWYIYIYIYIWLFQIHISQISKTENLYLQNLNKLALAENYWLISTCSCYIFLYFFIRPNCVACGCKCHCCSYCYRCLCVDGHKWGWWWRKNAVKRRLGQKHSKLVPEWYKTGNQKDIVKFLFHVAPLYVTARACSNVHKLCNGIERRPLTGELTTW